MNSTNVEAGVLSAQSDPAPQYFEVPIIDFKSTKTAIFYTISWRCLRAMLLDLSSIFDLSHTTKVQLPCNEIQKQMCNTRRLIEPLRRYLIAPLGE